MSSWGNHLQYDESSPSCLRWKHARGKSKVVKAGDVAGTLDREGRWSFVITKDGQKKRRYVHRVVYEMFHGTLADVFEIDHIDGNPANNKIANLRAVDRKINGRNIAKSTRNTTGVTGVACITASGYTYYAATYVTLQGKRVTGRFPVHKLGKEQAFIMACKKREEAIAALNAEGAGYTARHGK